MNNEVLVAFFVGVCTTPLIWVVVQLTRYTLWYRDIKRGILADRVQLEQARAVDQQRLEAAREVGQ